MLHSLGRILILQTKHYRDQMSFILRKCQNYSPYPSFGNCLSAYHLVLKHPQQSVFLSLFCIPKVALSATQKWKSDDIWKVQPQIKLDGAFFHCENVSKGSHCSLERKKQTNNFSFECFKPTLDSRICSKEFQKLNQSPQLCQNFLFRDFWITSFVRATKYMIKIIILCIFFLIFLPIFKILWHLYYDFRNAMDAKIILCLSQTRWYSK